MERQKGTGLSFTNVLVISTLAGMGYLGYSSRQKSSLEYHGMIGNEYVEFSEHCCRFLGELGQGNRLYVTKFDDASPPGIKSIHVYWDHNYDFKFDMILGSITDPTPKEQLYFDARIVCDKPFGEPFRDGESVLNGDNNTPIGTITKTGDDVVVKSTIDDTVITFRCSDIQKEFDAYLTLIRKIK